MLNFIVIVRYGGATLATPSRRKWPTTDTLYEIQIEESVTCLMMSLTTGEAKNSLSNNVTVPDAYGKRN